MRRTMTLISAGFVLAAPGFAHAARVELRDVYAKVQVIPEDRSDITVDVRSPDGKLRTPQVIRSGDSILVDGGLRPWNRCSGLRFGDTVYIPGHGYVSSRSALEITVHAPREVHISASGDVTGHIGAAKDLDLQTGGCSHWTLADVAGELSIRQGGASTIHAGAAGKAVLDLSGVTHIDLSKTNALDVDMSGVGNVRLGAIAGPIDARLSGMGSVNIAGGRADQVRAAVSGMGGFNLHGSAKALDAEVSGVGGVHVDRVNGPVHKSVSGIGRISVGA